MKRTRLSRKTGVRRKGRRYSQTRILDALWSKVVRQRGNWTCIIPNCKKAPQGCHIYPKGKYTALRHDPENGFPACYLHHIEGWHKDPDVQEFIRSRLEQERGPGFLEGLKLRAKTASRPDQAAIKLALEMELER